MKKCEAYHTRERYIYDPYITTMKHTIVEGECWGTMERDTCYCNGDKCQCDIYPHVKEKALKEKQQQECKQQHTAKNVAYVKDALNFYLDSSNKENEVVYIPKFMVEKMIEELENNG